MKKFLKEIIEKEFKTIEGKTNLIFGLALIIGFGFIEFAYNIKQDIWKLLFHTEPTSNSFTLLVGILIFLFFCVTLLFFADIYRKNNPS